MNPSIRIGNKVHTFPTQDAALAFAVGVASGTIDPDKCDTNHVSLEMTAQTGDDTLGKYVAMLEKANFALTKTCIANEAEIQRLGAVIDERTAKIADCDMKLNECYEWSYHARVALNSSFSTVEIYAELIAKSGMGREIEGARELLTAIRALLP